MKRLLICLLLVSVVGCSSDEELGSNHESKKETPSKRAEESSKNANPVKELTIDDVVGSYEKDSNQRFVFLDNGVAADYVLLMDPREFLKDSVKDLEKRLVNSTKEFGKDNVTTKAFAEMLAEEKEKLAAAIPPGPPEFPKDFQKMDDFKWEIKDGEVHFQVLGLISVYRMEPNGDLTPIRVVHKGGLRMDIPKEKQETLKKIK